jgi:ATP-binding cassette subfamily F protein uup
MAPPILYLEDVHLTFGGTPLIEGASMAIEARDRVALVGRNGSGKSTLMKIAAGMIEPDSGTRFLQPGVTLRYLPQEPDLSGHADVMAYVLSGLAPGDDPHRARMLLESLGMTGEESPVNISGGEARRAALARTLAPEPDILLLDEPTNHLDLPAIEWLEAELSRTRLSRRTIWMDRGVARSLDFGFGKFEDWRDEFLEQEEAERHKLGRKIEREQHWIVHGVSGRRKRNMRRVHELSAMRGKLSSARNVEGSVRISGNESEASGKLVAKLEHVFKSYDGRPIVRDFSTIIHRGDRVGIVGPNGAGKTTLIGLITGAIKQDSGDIRLGIGLEPLLIDQKREALKPEWTLREALTGGRGDTVQVGSENKHVMSYMKDFLFSPEQAGTPVSVLSGGERGRLLLARGLAKPSNLLVLDEPTNDLDLETLDLLQEFIADYSGTVILVSHDRDFIDRTCTNVIASDGDGVWRDYAGGYSDMVAQKGSGVAARKAAEAQSREKSASPATRSQTAAKSQKLSFKQKFALENLPGEIAKLEADIARLRRILEDPNLYSRDRKKFDAATAALAEREALLAQKEEAWLELEILRENAG